MRRRHKPVASDTVYEDTPAIDDGSNSAQIFFGKESLITDVSGMRLDKQFSRKLSDKIRQSSDMCKLISDRSQVEISNKIK